MISPLIPPDDFARQSSLEELAALVDANVERQVVVCSLLANASERRRAELGDVRADALLRELVVFIRRVLRSGDNVAVAGDEVVLLMEGTDESTAPALERLLSSVRVHNFVGPTADAPARVTLTIGVACRPQHGRSFGLLLAKAREARKQIGDDAVGSVDADSQDRFHVNRFVGRADRITKLCDLLDDMVRGAGNVIAVIGAPGVGASTLVQTLAPEIRHRGGSLIVAANHDRSLPAPYRLWGDVLRGVRRLPVKTTRVWNDLRLLDAAFEGADQQPVHGTSKARLLEELADFLRLAAQQRPLVVLLKNMHWADDASWDAFEYLAAQVEQERILLAVTLSSDPEAEASLERWRRATTRSRHQEIHLGNLTRDDVKRWLEGSMRAEDVPREVVSYVYRQSEGRPLHITHLLSDLAESGRLHKVKASWQLDLNDLPSSASLSTVIERRVSRLEAPARSLLEAASVLEYGGDESLLSSAAGASGESHLSTLVEAGLLCMTFDRGRTAFATAHPEVAQIIRSLIPAERLRELHERIAQSLASDDRASPSEISEHFERAGNNQQAHHFALAAADLASSLQETTAMADLLEAAQRTAPSEEALAEVRVRMIAVAEAAGRYDDAAALCNAALAWYESQSEQLPSLRLKRTRLLVRLKRGEAASEMLNELRALDEEARAAAADGERAEILLLMAQSHYRLGNSLEAQNLATQAVAIAEQGSDPVLLTDATNRLAVTIQLVNAKRARELFTRSLDLASSAGDAARIVRALNNLGVLEMINNNMDASRNALMKAIDIARTGGMLESWGLAELNLGVLAGRLGDYPAASRALSEALRLAASAQNSEYQLWATVNLANLERDHDRFHAGADSYGLVIGLAQRMGQAAVQAAAEAGYGLCRRQLGDLEAARAALGRALALTEAIDEWSQGRELVVTLRLHFMLMEGRVREAVDLLTESLELCDAVEVSSSAGLVAEFGEQLLPHAPVLVRSAVERYAGLPELEFNTRMKARFEALKRDIDHNS